MTPLPPVDYSVNVPLTPQDAFDLFTRQLPRWWPLSAHSCSGDEARDVVFEPHVGGSVTEVASNGERHVWGTLLEWNPPHGLAMSWHPGSPEHQATHLRVSFTPRDRSTDVRILHGGWEARGEQALDRRGRYETGWRRTMGEFVKAARAASGAGGAAT